jgi:hypothetical protein
VQLERVDAVLELVLHAEVHAATLPGYRHCPSER